MQVPTAQYFESNGTRLHYLDWGGGGQTVLFLAGMGCSAHIFDTFAPDKVPRAEVSVIDRGHHYCFLSHRQEVAELLERFLAAEM